MGSLYGASVFAFKKTQKVVGAFGWNFLRLSDGGARNKILNTATDIQEPQQANSVPAMHALLHVWHEATKNDTMEN